MRKMVAFLASLLLEMPALDAVMVSMMGGAIRARVDELIAPTSEMNRSSFGMMAAMVTRNAVKRDNVSHNGENIGMIGNFI